MKQWWTGRIIDLTEDDDEMHLCLDSQSPYLVWNQTDLLNYLFVKRQLFDLFLLNALGK